MSLKCTTLKHDNLTYQEMPELSDWTVLPSVYRFQQDGDYPASENPVVCEAQDSFMCSLTLDPKTSFVAMVTVSISDAVAPPVLLRVPARPGEKAMIHSGSHTN